MLCYEKMSLMEKWPNFFIVGAEKAGTTSLYEYLKDDPGVFLSDIKEPNFFTVNIKPEHFFCSVIRDKKQYLKLFSSAKEEIAIGEASPIYLMDPETPQLIKKTVPNAKIIILLRDPIQRALSSYFNSVRSGWESRPFNDVIRWANDLRKKNEDLTSRIIIEAGFYSDQVRRYLDIFGTEHVKIIIFEEFIQDPEKVTLQVLEFLGVHTNKPLKIEKIHNPGGIPRNNFSKIIIENMLIKKIALKIFQYGGSKKIRDRFLIKEIEKPQMEKHDREFLQELYSEDIKKLKKILNRSLPWDIVRE